jgi:hypothetical protein
MKDGIHLWYWSKAGNDLHCSEWKTDSPEDK